MASTTERRAANALVDDPDWCGHPLIDTSTWRCADCERPATPATRRRLEAAATAAPAGHVWVLTGGPGWSYDDDYAGGYVIGVFSDRAKIPWLLVRKHIIDAASLRQRLTRVTWYQGAINPNCIEGWGTDEDGDEVNYALSLEWIDHL